MNTMVLGSLARQTTCHDYDAVRGWSRHARHPSVRWKEIKRESVDDKVLLLAQADIPTPCTGSLVGCVPSIRRLLDHGVDLDKRNYYIESYWLTIRAAEHRTIKQLLPC